jgi:hypothetical protein
VTRFFICGGSGQIQAVKNLNQQIHVLFEVARHASFFPFLSHSTRFKKLGGRTIFPLSSQSCTDFCSRSKTFIPEASRLADKARRTKIIQEVRTMNAKLKLEDSVIASAKQFAQEHHTSVSKLVETYLKTITRETAAQKKAIGVVGELAGLLKGKDVDETRKGYVDYLEEKYS